MHLFEKVWNVGTETPRLQQVLRNITRTLLANPGMTFAEIPLLLWDDTVREKLVSNVTNTQTQLFWQQYNSKSQRDKDELTASTMNKVDAYLNEPLIANIVSQANTSINFRQIMDESKILLIQLSPQLEEVSRLLGAAIIGRLLNGSLLPHRSSRRMSGANLTSMSMNFNALPPLTGERFWRKPASLTCPSPLPINPSVSLTNPCKPPPPAPVPSSRFVSQATTPAYSGPLV